MTLGTLHLGDNPDADDVLPLTVTVEKVGTDQVRAKVLAGAPFAVDIPVTLVDGTLAGSVTELSVAAGEVYSEPVTMTRTVGTTAAATVDVDLTTQPTLPADNSGYIFIKAATGLPETILPGSGTPAAPTNFRTTPGDGQVALAWDAPVSGSGVTGHEYRYKTTGTYTSWTAITDSGVGGATGVTVTGLTNAEAYTFELRAVNATGEGAAAAVVVIPMLGICGRTQQIEDAILAAISGVDDCAEVTDANLAAITSFSDTALIFKEISTLRRGDFAGLTSLTAINLFGNSLTSLPEGIFAGLAELTHLDLESNQLASLPEGVFDGLVKLKILNLGGNSFTGFPAGTFAGLTAMHTLELNENGLTTLPDGLFFGLTALDTIELSNNKLDSLDAGVFSGLTSLRLLSLDNNELSSLPGTVFSDTVLSRLTLDGNKLTTLPDGLFSGLIYLSTLSLSDNALNALPDGVFSGLELTNLYLGGNPTDPLPLTVTVEKVGTDQVRARVLAGVPFAVDIPVAVSNGTLAGSVTVLGVAAGEVDGTALTVTRTAGTTAAVTVDVDLTTQPTLPTEHSGYEFVKATTGLPVTILPKSGTPAAPAGFMATVGNQQVTLAWDPSGSGVTGHVYRYRTTGIYGSWIAVTGSGVGGATEVTVTGLTNEVAHTFELRAVNATGDGASAAAGPVTPTPGICDRTQQVHEFIVSALSGVDDCAAVTVPTWRGTDIPSN